MKKKYFPLDKVLKYRSHLEKDQAARFRDAMSKESHIDSTLTTHQQNLKGKIGKRDDLISSPKLDMNHIKSLQEEILFDELDEAVLKNELAKAKNMSERERREWLNKKSDRDAIDKLKDKFIDSVKAENTIEEQKEIDEIARQNFLSKVKEQ
jgi:flagellar export protein FliJ